MRTLQVMDTVAVRAGRNVRVARRECPAVNSVFVGVVYLRVALSTCQRDARPGLTGWTNIVGTVTVGAYGGIHHAGLTSEFVVTVKGLGVFGIVARRTCRIHLQCEIPAALGRDRIVRIGRDTRVTQYARYVELAVDRIRICIAVNANIECLTRWERYRGRTPLVTGETVAVVPPRVLLCGRGRLPDEQDHGADNQQTERQNPSIYSSVETPPHHWIHSTTPASNTQGPSGP